MRYIINEKMIVTMKGASVKPVRGEVVYDDRNDDYAIATMREIANANGFKIKGKSKTQVKKVFDSELSNLNIPKVSKMAISEKVKNIVSKGHKDGKSENEILIEIVNSGVDFQKAIKQLKKAQVELGLAISNEERAKRSKKILEKEDFDPQTYDDVLKMTAKITKDVPNTNEQQALVQIRKYCKDNEIAIPKKPKGAGMPDMVKIFVWLHQNIEKATADEFKDFLNQRSRPEKVVDNWLVKFGKMQTLLGIENKPAKETKKKGGSKKK